MQFICNAIVYLGGFLVIGWTVLFFWFMWVLHQERSENKQDDD